MPIDRIALLQEYLQDDPGDRFSRYALGLEFIKMNELAQAWGCFEHLLEHAPDYLPTYFQAGLVLEAQGRQAEAVRIYKEGIGWAKTQADDHTRAELQGALFKLEDPDEA